MGRTESPTGLLDDEEVVVVADGRESKRGYFSGKESRVRRENELWEKSCAV